MHRQYFQVFKLPMNLRFLGQNQSLTNKAIRKLHVNLQQLNPKSRSLETRLVLLSLARPPVLNNCNGIKYFSQQISKSENVTVEKSDTSSNVSSKTSTETHVDAIEDLNSISESQNQFNLYEDINYDEITEGDEENLNKFKLLMLEIDVLRQDGMPVPSKMSTQQWKELFALPTRSQRRKYLTFLFKTEMKKLSDRRKKELKRLAKLEETKEGSVESPSDKLQYGFRGSTIFLRVYDSSINFFDNYRLIRAMMFGQDLVVDCGFYNEMNTMENKLCCKQLVYLFAENRVAKDPFNLHFCNLKKDSILYHLMKSSVPTLEDPSFPINIHEEHYLDLFPKEKLVYLTPHCRNELKEFDPDDIYIIGAIVDRVNTQPLTLAKAKSEGLRMAQLPLDRYLDWAIGNKSLTINQVLKIMNDAMVTGDWNTALKHVPQRKLRRPEEPFKDFRKPWKRGTAFQPPPRFEKYY